MDPNNEKFFITPVKNKNKDVPISPSQSRLDSSIKSNASSVPPGNGLK